MKKIKNINLLFNAEEMDTDIDSRNEDVGTLFGE